MTSKNILTCLLLSFQISIFGQKSKSIYILPTFSYKDEIFGLANYPNGRSSRLGYTNEFQKQFGLRSFGLDISTNFLKDRLTINFSTYFRYGHLYYDRNLQKEVKSFKGDLFIDFLYNFRKPKETSFGFFASLGFGKANIGTKFRYNYIEAVDSAGNPYLKEGVGTFKFNTARILAGVKKGKWVFTLSVMGTPDEDKQPFLSISIEPKIAYNIFSFKVPVKKKQ